MFSASKLAEVTCDSVFKSGDVLEIAAVALTGICHELDNLSIYGCVNVCECIPVDMYFNLWIAFYTLNNI